MRWLAVLVFIVFAATPGAFAQPAADEVLYNNCDDDDGEDQCDADVQRRVRSMFEVQSIEELGSAGAQVRRVFFVDGYGSDMPVVSFERVPGESPRVEVSVRTFGDEERVVKMVALAPLPVWASVLRETTYFDRTFAPLPPGPPSDELSICLHSWVVTIEAADPNEERPIRRSTQDACNDGLAVGAGFEMARHAYELLPHCNALDLNNYRNVVVLLAACALLEGDRIAAAEATNRYEDLDGVYGEVRRQDFDDLLHENVRLDWPDEPTVNGVVDAAAYWTRHMNDHWRYARSFHGEGPDRVTISGRLVQRSARDRDRQGAAFEQVWVRENGFDFRLLEMRVGAFSRDEN
jgi:hypothetical protein